MPFHRVGSLTLHYRLDGPPVGPLVVLLHSLGTNLHLWDEVLPHLPRGYRVLRVDFRGHGLSDCPPAETFSVESMADDVLGLIADLEPGPFLLAGVSLGGQVALQIASLAPDRVEALALFDTGLRIGTADSWNQRIAAVREGGLEGIADAVLGRWLSQGCIEANGPEVAGLRRMFLTTPVEGYVGGCLAVRDADLTAAAGGIERPSVVVVGEADLATPLADAQALSAALGPVGGEILPPNVLPGLSHLPMAEAPGLVGSFLTAFMETLAEHFAPPLFDRGMVVRRAVLGDAHVNRSMANANAFNEDFQALATQVAWGLIWTRPGLERRVRSLITIAMLAALGREEELALHLRAYPSTGATDADIKEVLLQVAAYAGLPASNSAFALARRILDARDEANAKHQEEE